MRAVSSRFAVTFFVWIALTPAAFAQTQFQSLVETESFRDYPAAGAAAGLEVQAFKSHLPSALKRLENEERALLELKGRIESYGHSAVDFLNLMQAMDAASVQAVRASVQEAKPLVLELTSRLDAYIQDTLDLSIAIGLNSARADLANVRATADMRGLYKELIKQRDIYLANKKEYGEGKDTRRTTAYNEFFATLKNLYTAIEAPAFSKTRRVARNLGEVMSKAAWASQRPALVWSFLKTLGIVLKSPQPVDGQNPLIAAVMKLSRQLGREMNIKVSIEGKENLPSASAPDEITILVPSHREMMKDQIGVANLHFEDGTEFDGDRIAPFAAAHVYPGFIVKRLNPNNGIIVVGRAAEPKPVPKILQIAEQTDLRMFMNYAGGRLPEGLGASMGVRKKFFEMVRALEEKGFKVNILAVTMRDNAKLFGTRSLTRNEDIVVKVVPVLRHETRHLIMQVGGEDAVALMMRMGVIQDLVTNDELIFGQVRGSKLVEALSEYVFGPASCEKLLKLAP